MSLGMVGNIVNLIREIDLGGIKREAEQQFTLLVAGDPEQTAVLAEELSREPERGGTHPWIEREELPLPQAAKELGRYDLALLLIDQLEMSEGEESGLRRLHEARVPVIVVVANEAATRQVGAEVKRRREAARVLLSTPLERATLEKGLAETMIQVAPEELRLALARQLPLLRGAAARQLIEEVSRANALYALSTGVAQSVPVLNIPLAAGDVMILTKNQLVMAYKIALLAGKQGEASELMGEVVSVVGGGVLFRQIARELIGLIPVVGIIPKVAVAYAGTLVIGRTVYLWATEGERLNAEEVRRFYDEALARGRALAESLIEKVRERSPALPAPGEQRWWHRFRRSRPALPDQTEGERSAIVPTSRRGWWRRLRDILPF